MHTSAKVTPRGEAQSSAPGQGVSAEQVRKGPASGTDRDQSLRTLTTLSEDRLIHFGTHAKGWDLNKTEKHKQNGSQGATKVFLTVNLDLGQ